MTWGRIRTATPRDAGTHREGVMQWAVKFPGRNGGTGEAMGRRSRARVAGGVLPTGAESSLKGEKREDYNDLFGNAAGGWHSRAGGEHGTARTRSAVDLRRGGADVRGSNRAGGRGNGGGGSCAIGLYRRAEQRARGCQNGEDHGRPLPAETLAGVERRLKAVA